jgi:hypothetical protein
MKHLLTILFVLCFITVYGQVQMRTALRAQVYASTGSGNIFSVQAITGDDLGRFDATFVVPGDLMYVIDGSFCYELEIISVQFQSGTLLQCTVRDNDSVLTNIPTGQAAILSPYPNYNLTYFIASLRADLQSCLFHRTVASLDNIVDTSLDTIVRRGNYLDFYITSKPANIPVDTLSVLVPQPELAIAAGDTNSSIIYLGDGANVDTTYTVLVDNNNTTIWDGFNVIATIDIVINDITIQGNTNIGVTENVNDKVIQLYLKAIEADNVLDATSKGIQSGEAFKTAVSNTMGLPAGVLIFKQ